MLYRSPVYIKRVQKWPLVSACEIPAIEISNNEKLCKQPLVSVMLITYNQKRYIRDALDGILAQQVNFEYEILVGDDCSTDGTGDVCREYQRRYPERIRLITASQNVSKLGGNARRLRWRARGKYHAWLEGDDYWTDARKLAKQVEILENDRSVTACFSGCEELRLTGEKVLRKTAHFDDLFLRAPNCEGVYFGLDDFFISPIGDPLGNLMYRAEDWQDEEVASFFNRTSYMWFYLLLKKGRGYIFRQPMMICRINQGGVWNGLSTIDQKRRLFELWAELLLHEPENEILKGKVRAAWNEFRPYVFPWCWFVLLRLRLGCLKQRLKGWLCG